MKKGSQVRLIQTVVEGKVVAVKYNEDSDSKSMCVEFVDQDKETQLVWFDESRLKELKEEKEKEKKEANKLEEEL